MFFEIINSLVNPIKVLFSPQEDEHMNEIETNYNPNYIKALKRIFRIFDNQRKGKITKNEFMKIHKQIFEKEIESDHFEALKELIKSINSNRNEIMLENEIDLNGFIAINQSAVNIQEAQITWSILRKYGYNDNLVLDESYLKFLDLKNTNDYVVEISDYSINILAKIFKQYSKLVEKNGVFVSVISEREWEIIFSSCIELHELKFKETLKTYKIKKHELEVGDWFFFWSCYTRINSQNAYQTFLYIGNEIEYNTFVNSINRSNINILKPLSQKTVYVGVIGEKYDEFHILQNYLSGENLNNDNDNNNINNINFDGKQTSDNYYLSYNEISYIVNYSFLLNL